MQLILIVLGACYAHVEIQSPAPRRSKYSSYYRSKGNIDYDLNIPIGSKSGLVLPYPCRGVPPGPAQVTYKPGETIDIKFAEADSNNYHNGGHCQFGLSYDNGQSIVVLKTILRSCFLNGLNFPVTIPSTAASSKSATLTWTWVNNEGEREYYMNCVDIAISGNNPNGQVTGPENLVVNLPGYETIPEFYAGDRQELFSRRKNITIPRTYQ